MYLLSLHDVSGCLEVVVEEEVDSPPALLQPLGQPDGPTLQPLGLPNPILKVQVSESPKKKVIPYT